MWRGFDRLVGVTPRIRWKGLKQLKLLEVEVPAVGEAAGELWRQSCEICGNVEPLPDATIALKKETISESIDIFRPRNFPTVVIVSERLAEEITRLELSNSLLQEVSLT